MTLSSGYLLMALDYAVGMWTKGADGTDINACCVNGGKTLLVSADDFGKVNLMSYPSRTPEVSRL